MKIPNVRSIKVYAVVESVVDVHGITPDELDAYVRNAKFKGSTEVVYNCGGIRGIIVREHIPLTMQKLDAVLEKA